jgi:hypothetical protein
MHQQRRSGPGRGGYPDSWYLPDNVPVQGVDINPETISKVLFRIMGLPSSVDTVIVQKPALAHVSVLGSLSLEHSEDHSTSLRVSGWEASHRRMLIAGRAPVAALERWHDGQWVSACEQTRDDDGRLWVDWGEEVPPSMTVRIRWATEASD